MVSVRASALCCALAAGFLSGCGGGGGGGGGSAGGGDTDLVNNTLYVSLSYANASVPLYGAATVTPTASGFQGRTPRCTLASGNLPAGMAFQADCSITGRPTVPGAYSFQVNVGVDGFAGTVGVSGSLWVASPVVTYAGHTYPALAVGTGLADLPQLSGWTAPGGVSPTFQYSVANGALPPGLALDPVTGVISGTIGAQGTFRAGVATTMTTAFGTYQLPVTDYAVNADIDTFSYLDSGGTGSVGGFYQAWIGIAYGSAPWASDPITTLSAFHILSGTLPAGLTLDAATGSISGTPLAQTAPTTVGVGATVSEFGVDNATQADFKVRVDPPAVIGWSAATTMPVNQPFSVSLASTTAVGFSTPLTIVATQRPGACSVPPGMTMVTTGYVSGTPTATGVFDCTVDFTLTLNGASWNQEGRLTLTVQ